MCFNLLSYYSVTEGKMQKLKKHCKTLLILAGALTQGFLISRLLSGQLSTLDASLAGGEVPEPGTILLFGMGALILRCKNSKSGK